MGEKHTLVAMEVIDLIGWITFVLDSRNTMKVLLDIKDDKAQHLLEVLKGLSYVKTKQLTDAKAQLLGEIREAVEEMKLIRAGKKMARNAEDFLNEL